MIPLFVVYAVFDVVGTDLLDEAWVVGCVPMSEEQPGPPFSHRVTGSLLLGPFTDSTKI